ncbi:hypothetical protein [Nostoc sp. JL33]|uniref:hypothetical protein n=1 Tax=Nostoc sp. JL33 TaxID=2815396 RepID=UPI0025E59FB4|nr:hypothetical protein [Nostoc sp. JL33]MBN3873188.1 hypothetical protein [Nostoc sp. JL33]
MLVIKDRIKQLRAFGHERRRFFGLSLDIALREKSAIAVELINLRSLPAGGYAIATEFLRLGSLRSNFFFSPTAWA